MAKIEMTWHDDNLFESVHNDGVIMVDNALEGAEKRGMRPKALMLTSLAGCSALDIVSLLKKMRAEVDDFKIHVSAELTDEHPKIYKDVVVTYKFYGKDFKKSKIQKAIDLSVDQYCGVMEMFRKFTTVKIEVEYHEL